MLVNPKKQFRSWSQASSVTTDKSSTKKLIVCPENTTRRKKRENFLMSTAVFFASNTKAKLNKKSRTTISKLIAVNTNTITLD